MVRIFGGLRSQIFFLTLHFRLNSGWVISNIRHAGLALNVEVGLGLSELMILLMVIALCAALQAGLYFLARRIGSRILRPKLLLWGALIYLVLGNSLSLLQMSQSRNAAAGDVPVAPLTHEARTCFYRHDYPPVNASLKR